MSVRLLAQGSVQPSCFDFSSEMKKKVSFWIAKYPEERKQSAVVPLLALAQEQEGWVSRAAIEHVANMLGMPYIRVFEVATFYTQFHLSPVGTCAHVQVCGTISCMLRGAESLTDVCRTKIHPQPHCLNEDKTLSWEEVECIGACVNAPAVMILKDIYEDLTPDRLSAIIDLFHAREGATVPPGSQVNRFNLAPQSGFTSLIEEQLVLEKRQNPSLKSSSPKLVKKSEPSSQPKVKKMDPEARKPDSNLSCKERKKKTNPRPLVDDKRD